MNEMIWKWDKEKMEWTAAMVHGITFRVRASQKKKHQGWFAYVEVKGKTITDGRLHKNADLAQAACWILFEKRSS